MKFQESFLCLLFMACIFFFNPCITHAQIQIDTLETGKQFTRSLESLRDLDSKTWQIVAYKKQTQVESSILRIVGYPGSLRINHPTPLLIHSGRRDWKLEDKTLSNKQLAKDTREAAAEFDLTPLIQDLEDDRPLRLNLDGAFNELPVPPYLVSEWFSFLKPESINVQN